VIASPTLTLSLSKGGLVLDVQAGDARLGRALIGNDLGPAAAAMDQALHLGNALLHRLDHLIIFGHNRATGVAGRLEKPAHIDVPRAQGGGRPDHGFAHPGRQGVEHDKQGRDTCDGRGQKKGSASVLQQAAERDAEVER
jgi:hypothetical protein